jgi:hypothetical protein
MATIIGPFLFGIKGSSVDWIIVDASKKETLYVFHKPISARDGSFDKL